MAVAILSTPRSILSTALSNCSWFRSTATDTGSIPSARTGAGAAASAAAGVRGGRTPGDEGSPSSSVARPLGLFDFD